ncbi:APC family permease [Mycolicibacterium sp.]|uniref:APC family permease n=1 Tax=Mycolicibacterium sp. TaxID=2320850 RepID=UPI00355CB550
MSTFDIVFTVLAFAGPLAVFAGYLTVIIGYGNGLGAPMTQLVIGLLVLVFAWGFTAMSKNLPNPGGFYAFVAAGLGRPIGLGAALLAFIAYALIYVQAFIYLANTLSSTVAVVFGGPSIPSWAFQIPLVIIIAILGYLRIALSAKILTVALCLEVVLVVVFDVVVIAQGGSEGHTAEPFQLDAVFSGSIGLAALFCIGTFIGFEATAIFREEARDPATTIPRATYITIGVIALLYSVTSYALIIAIGPSSVVDATAADPVGAANAAVGKFLGGFGQDLVLLLLCNGIFAVLVAAHNITARYLFSMGHDRVLPSRFGLAHGKHHSPYVASMATSGFAAICLIVLQIAGLNDTTFYARLAGIAIYVLMALLVLTSVAIPAYFWSRRSTEFSRVRTLVAPTLAGLGFAGSLVLATQNADFLVGGSKAAAATAATLTVVIALLAGIAYALTLRRRRPETYARIGRQEL